MEAKDRKVKLFQPPYCPKLELPSSTKSSILCDAPSRDAPSKTMA